MSERITDERLAEIADVIERETNPDTATELGWSLLERELLLGLKYEKVRVKELERKHSDLVEGLRKIIESTYRENYWSFGIRGKLKALLEQEVRDG